MIHLFYGVKGLRKLEVRLACVYTSRHYQSSGWPMNNRIHRTCDAMDRLRAAAISTILLALCLLAMPGWAQQSNPPADTTQQGGQAQGQKQQPPPQEGGPQGDTGPYAIPKKTDEKPAPAPPPLPKPPEGMPNYSISVNVPEVQVGAMVLTKDGHFIPGLRREHFRVLEDGVEQKITDFRVTEAPFTAVLLIEFSEMSTIFLRDALNAAYAFAQQMHKDDYVAVIEYDMKPTTLVDFTNDKTAVYQALDMLHMPGFRESNMFDALYDTLDRLDRIEGRKEVILIGSGLDTFSKITYDKILKKIKETPNVTIFAISTGFLVRNWLDLRPGMRAQMTTLSFLQADNETQTFCRMTGGRWFQPRFTGELPELFREVSADVRHQYTILYHPLNTKLDGTFRKLKVELVQPGTDKPLIVKDEKNKELKYQVIARDGYTAKHTVE